MSTSDQRTETIRQLLHQAHTTKHGITPVEAGESTEPNGVILGHAIDTGERITLGEIEHRSWLYVLGKPGMGKSTLLVNLMDQYIKHGHGLFFLDPHGDAIDDLINCCDSDRMKDSVRLLDPENEGCSFGLNLFSCKDITSWTQRKDTYNKARWVFKKLFEKELGEKPWLELIIPYTVYAFIENQEYTLNEVPRFLTDQSFRNNLVGNIKYEPQVADFWNYRFKQKQAEALQTRVETFLAHATVRDIVGQRQTAIDFSKIIEEREIILVKLSATLAPDIQKFIGTILISELLQAIRQRQYIPADQRHQFCIFVDEFQNFTSFEDFSTLINEGRKFGVATTFAHQERYGQLSEDKKIQGATAAAASKIFFQTTVRDGQEQAPEFSNQPPTETRLEPQPVLLISQEPVSDLLRVGHTNPTIHNFVNQYLRPLQDSMEDIKERMEGGKLLRDYYRDVAGLARIDERIAALDFEPKRYRTQYDAVSATLARAESALESVLGQDVKLLKLHESSKELRLSKRGLDRFLTAIMEGRISQGQEAFSAFLMYLIRVPAFSLVPEQKREVLDLYIALMHGNPKKLPVIPFAFAQAHGLLQPDVTKIQQDAEEKLKREKEEFVKSGRDNYREKCRKWLADKKEKKQKRTEAVLQDLRALSEWRIHELDGGSARYFLEYNMLSMLRAYILLLEYPDVEEVLKPYYTARLAPPWRDKFPKFSEAMPFISDYLERDRRENAKAQEFIRKHNSWIWGWSEPEPHEFYYSDTRFKNSLLNAFQDFIERHWEGALVVYILLRTTNKWVFSYKNSRLDVDMQYPGYNMLYLPAIEYREPLEIALTLERLTELVDPNNNNNNLFNKEVDYTKYYWRVDGKKDFEGLWDNKLIIYPSFRGVIHKQLEKMSDWKTMRDDLQLLRKEVEKDVQQQALHELARSAYGYYPQHSQLVINYLQCRACDIVRYGQKVADLTFPQPTLPGVTTKSIADAVNWMENQLQKRTDPDGEKEYIELLAHYEYRLRKNSDEKFSKQIIPMPDIHRHALTYNEIEALKSACLKELRQGGWNPQATLDVIGDFVEFCDLLIQPENHINRPSMQYVKKQVNTRTFRDMEDEAAQKLIKLPRYIAYAKVIQEQEGEQVVIERKIKTSELPPVLANWYTQSIREQIEQNTLNAGMVKERVKIEEEIRERQGKWRRQIPDSKRQLPPSEEPPPTSY